MPESFDWTAGADGTSNTSDEYRAMVSAVDLLINDSAHDLIGGRSEYAARLIVSQLAHAHGLGPVRPRRGSDIERWLRRKRDEQPQYGDGTGDWYALDALLNEYRLHADTGTPLADAGPMGPPNV